MLEIEIDERCAMRAPSAGAARWSRSVAPAAAPLAPAQPAPGKLPHDDQIHQRFAVWQGDISTLDAEAITNTTDGGLSNDVSERIMLAAGPGLKEEILTRAHDCLPGEVFVTPGYNLRCRHIIHTVSPKYNPSQHATSETELQSCYRNVLCKASELGVRSVALGLLSKPENSYPQELAAQVALRTIRQHLDLNKTPHLVILATTSERQRALVTSLSLRHFPRDRRVRIIHNPRTDDTDDDSEVCDDDAAVEAATMLARACTDTQRLLAPDRRPQLRLDDHHQCQYERLLRRAHTEDLTEVSGIGCLYQSGVDRLGRPVVIFIGKWFPISDIDLDKALLYLIKLLDPIVSGDYVIAYFHTLASSANHPPFSWLKEVYTVLPYKYKKNLKAFYIVHPTFWTKMMTWWFTTFMAPAIKAKVHNLPGVEYLYSVMARDQLELPAFVTEYDMTINGLHYFQPETTTT